MLGKAKNDVIVTVVHRKQKQKADGATEMRDMSNSFDAGKKSLVLPRLPDHRGSNSPHGQLPHANTICTVLFILLIGVSGSVFVLVVGVRGARNDSDNQFTSGAIDVVGRIHSSFQDYEFAGLWLHQACHRPFDQAIIPINESVSGNLGICTRKEFRTAYEYINSTGITTIAVHLLVNITNNIRAEVEDDARIYFKEKYPFINYHGIQEFLLKPINGSLTGPSQSKPFYFPIHYSEPVYENKEFVDLDLYSSSQRRKAIDSTLLRWKPTVTERIKYVTDLNDPRAYTVLLMHPGIPTTTENISQSNSLSLQGIRIPDLITRVCGSLQRSQQIYLFDSTNTSKPALFLGASKILVDQKGVSILSIPELELSSIPQSSRSHIFQSELSVAGRRWTVVVVSDSYQPVLFFVIFGGVGIVFASVLTAIGYYSLARRMKKIKSAKAEADIANRLSLWEQQLNEHMAHEVRNPLASAIAALSFVSARANSSGMNDKAHLGMIRDVGIVDASLQYIDQLLRNMLDYYRAGSNQMKLDIQPTDIRKDILEPVSAILVTRQVNVEINIDCPENLIINTDRMRLKQIVLNLSANAVKFVQRGFIQLRAENISGNVHLFVEDSGPGIPVEKQDCLFMRFQDSLDRLNQGTGIGLSVVKSLSDLMGINVSLDRDYLSSVEGCPGTRFVLCMNQPPNNEDQCIKPIQDEHQKQVNLTCFDLESNHHALEEVSMLSPPTLPESISVLYVDDDMIVRKMLLRCIRRVAPNWHVHEAASGEAALELVKTQHYDLIFMDQYMASIDKQLLGTETVHTLRKNGISCRICGLSANDVEHEFLEAGANAFMLKPFPCEMVALTNALLRILQTN